MLTPQASDRGCLTVVGTGIHVGQMTLEAVEAVKVADLVLTIVSDLSYAFLLTLNRQVESLSVLYSEGESRMTTYEQMVTRVMQEVRSGKRVCFVMYGHPGVLVYPTREAMRLAREEGFAAIMLPGVSSQDCLFADMGIDPGDAGIQSFEAGYFTLHNIAWEQTAFLVLWQVGSVCDPEFSSQYPMRGIKHLQAKLLSAYGRETTALIYEAPELPVLGIRRDRISLESLHVARLTSGSTLVIYPSGKPKVDVQAAAEIYEGTPYRLKLPLE